MKTGYMKIYEILKEKQEFERDNFEYRNTKNYKEEIHKFVDKIYKTAREYDLIWE